MNTHAMPPKMMRMAKPTATLMPMMGPDGRPFEELAGCEPEDIVDRKLEICAVLVQETSRFVLKDRGCSSSPVDSACSTV